MAPVVPSTKTARPPEPHEQAAGPVPDGICPPRETQLDHGTPPSVVVLDQMPPSLPRTKTVIPPRFRDVAAGSEVRVPPRKVEFDQIVPS